MATFLKSKKDYDIITKKNDECKLKYLFLIKIFQLSNNLFIFFYVDYI